MKKKMHMEYLGWSWADNRQPRKDDTTIILVVVVADHDDCSWNRGPACHVVALSLETSLARHTAGAPRPLPVAGSPPHRGMQPPPCPFLGRDSSRAM